MAVYETPGNQKFAETIVPYLKDCNTIILANHGTVTFGPTVEAAYFNTEIIDAYCRILILARQLGRVNYFDEQKTKELLELKKRLGYDDVRFHREGCSVCGDSSFDHSYSDFVPQPHAFVPESAALISEPSHNGSAGTKRGMDDLVRTITDQVMAALAGAGV
jgi:L-fuculose-phosphate aldolase